MPPEPRKNVEARQQAARRWLDNYADRSRNNPPNTTYRGDPSTATYRALCVVVLTHATSNYLAEFDPQALKQAQIALNGKSWEDFKV
jgi:hypothetical protein